LDADNHDHVNAIAALLPEVAGEGDDDKIEILRRIGESEKKNQRCFECDRRIFHKQLQ
jgi:hypothetical protein